MSRSNAERGYDSSPTTRSGYAQGGRPRYSEGEWFVEANKTADIHYGEMILPGRVAQAVRDELSKGKQSSTSYRGGSVVNITVNVQRASEAEAIRLARMVKRNILREDELMAIGDGRLVGPIR